MYVFFKKMQFFEINICIKLIFICTKIEVFLLFYG